MDYTNFPGINIVKAAWSKWSHGRKCKIEQIPELSTAFHAGWNAAQENMKEELNIWSNNPPQKEGLYRCCRVYWHENNKPIIEFFNVRIFVNFYTGTKNYGKLVQEKTLFLVEELGYIWHNNPMSEPEIDIETLKGFYPEYLDWEALQKL